MIGPGFLNRFLHQATGAPFRIASVVMRVLGFGFFISGFWGLSKGSGFGAFGVSRASGFEVPNPKPPNP